MQKLGVEKPGKTRERKKGDREGRRGAQSRLRLPLSRANSGCLNLCP